ncbi:copper resistance CopC family protein [Cohnella rhizosphaerae]|uniref:Copper resistance protein CopC n=1 Tax=Cohnella rhizosphaerae TaxID=1457232 RepID=A0A9X4KVB7_9BACL|nr:copper resistance CopC family protein [Cohnella rhizosphaerae]MDG0808717.1 copper resistance protein CopC [Cohnella rhizosphaerae]
MRNIEKAGTGNGGSRKAFARSARRTGMLALWLVLMAAAAALFAPAASAHAVLEKAVPAQDAQLAAGPDFVELTFNERLDGGATARLAVLNGDSKAVASGKPERISQGKGLRLALPKLGEGHYTVSYSVISADGHPVEGAYVFTVGNPPPLTDAAELDPHAQLGHSSHNHGGRAGSDDDPLYFLRQPGAVLRFAARAVRAVAVGAQTRAVRRGANVPGDVDRLDGAVRCAGDARLYRPADVEPDRRRAVLRMGPHPDRYDGRPSLCGPARVGVRGAAAARNGRIRQAGLDAARARD